jgi:putative transcriptional regulator
MSLRPKSVRDANTVAATMTLAKRGLSLLKAKRTVEEMVASGRAIVELPMVEDQTAVVRELAEAGVIAHSHAQREVNIKSLRQRLGLTQEQFCLRYGIDIDTLQNWERKRRMPDQAARSLMRIIEKLPEEASVAQEDLATAERERVLAHSH